MDRFGPWLEVFCDRVNSTDLDTNVPEWNKCFRQTVLFGLPCLLLWFLLPFEIFGLRKGSKSRPIPWNNLNSSRLVIVAFCTFLAIWETINGFFGGHEVPPFDLYVPLLKVASFVSF